MAYTFSTTILSAAKYSNPPVTTPGLTGTGVRFLSAGVQLADVKTIIISLSTLDAGLSFNRLDVNVTNLSSLSLSTTTLMTINGSVFSIPTLLVNTQMAVMKVLSNNIRSWSTFTAGISSVALSSITSTIEVSDSETRRKYILGYL